MTSLTAAEMGWIEAQRIYREQLGSPLYVQFIYALGRLDLPLHLSDTYGIEYRVGDDAEMLCGAIGTVNRRVMPDYAASRDEPPCLDCLLELVRRQT